MEVLSPGTLLSPSAEVPAPQYLGCCGPRIRQVYRGYSRDNGKENGNYRDYRGYIGVMLGLYSGFRSRRWG